MNLRKDHYRKLVESLFFNKVFSKISHLVKTEVLSNRFLGGWQGGLGILGSWPSVTASVGVCP